MTYNADHIKKRLHGIVDSRLQTFKEDANAARAANIQQSSAQGHAIGKLARSQCYGALDRVLLAYINYCKTERADTAERIADVQTEINWFVEQILAATSQVNRALVENYLEQFVKDADVAYHDAKTGRLHDEQLYRHEPAWRSNAKEIFKMSGATLAWILALVQIVQALLTLPPPH